ncbi:MAG: GNAT family N-acetyltransferase [Reichenbachiella sp.]|uniref:GNAT family N-acetyltransferase n=1 Tax=Reichenbachiella sp. TaxID=2184521 RepID=UPI002966D0CA|nr:GNAT family N-acetyltransferase [Reichenbachiella sp.]MDW3212088.1 GNAT family N-acetyltransferase [Reichenbachiella sp.]
MNNITIRPATLEDLPILYEFEQGIIQAERPFDPTLKSGHINYYDLKALTESDQAEVLVAEVAGEVVASGYAHIKDGKDFQSHKKFAYLGFMFVKPDHRGQGIITQILDELKSWSQSRGINEIRLEVYDDNEPAVRAYEKAGFKKHLVEMRMSIN